MLYHKLFWEAGALQASQTPEYHTGMQDRAIPPGWGFMIAHPKCHQQLSSTDIQHSKEATSVWGRVYALGRGGAVRS